MQYNVCFLGRGVEQGPGLWELWSDAKNEGNDNVTESCGVAWRVGCGYPNINMVAQFSCILKLHVTKHLPFPLLKMIYFHFGGNGIIVDSFDDDIAFDDSHNIGLYIQFLLSFILQLFISNYSSLSQRLLPYRNCFQHRQYRKHPQLLTVVWVSGVKIMALPLISRNLQIKGQVSNNNHKTHDKRTHPAKQTKRKKRQQRKRPQLIPP